jgi:DNA-binding NtrC family response regulator
MSPSPIKRGELASSDTRTWILLVEDELLIRLMLADELREAGHHVIEACDADEAVIILQTVTPDLIISDVRMPGSMDGMGLLALVRKSRPELPVIITSGHLQPAQAMAEGAASFVAKPYGWGVLSSASHEVLAGRGNVEGR